MSENLSREHSLSAAETINLNEEDSITSTVGLYSIIKRLLKHIRISFSSNSDSSVLSALLERVYSRLIFSRIRLTAIFLLSFSIVAILISFVTNNSLGIFISDIDSFSAFALLLLSFVLFTSNKTLHQALINSKFLNLLSIVYNEQNSNNSDSIPYQISTPFFLGIICGIFSVIYPVSVICTFIISVLISICIFNRPECGMLIIIAILPFLSKPILLTFTCITFLALLYRYLLGKRHIDFDLSALLMTVTTTYIIIRCASSEGPFVSSRL